MCVRGGGGVEVLLVQHWREESSSLDWCKGGEKREGEAKEGERRHCVECDGEQRFRGLMSARLAEGEGESRKMELWGEGDLIPCGRRGLGSL